MKYIQTLLLSIFCCWLCAKNVAISNIPTLNQLPVNAIHRVFQDSDGYMWYGTVNGLCRDDGYHVQVFRSDIHTPGLLDNNLIECIAEDKEGKIWFGTDKGAYILDKKDYTVFPLDVSRLKDQFIYQIKLTSDGTMWVSVQGELLKYNTDGILIKTYPIKNGDRSAFVGGFCESRKGDILITYSDGLIHRLNKDTDTFQPYPSGLKRNNPTLIIQDKDYDYYWLVTWGDGLVRFDPSAPVDSMYIYQPLPVNFKGEKSPIIFYLAQDDQLGCLWATTTQGMVAFSRDEKGMLKQVFFPDLLPASNCMLNEIIRDHLGNLWVSAFDQPSFILHFMDDTPKGYPLPAIRERVGYNPAVMALVDSGDGIMWLSQERTGILLYNIQSDEVSCYLDFEETKLLPLNGVKIISETISPGAAWIVPVNSKKAFRLGRKGMRMNLVNTVDLSSEASSGIIQKVLENARGKKLWLGTSTGLYSYDLENKNINALCDTIGFVTAMTEASSGDLWICTSDKGLYKLQTDGTLESYPVDHSLSSVTMTTDGMLWLGTDEGGLYSFDPRTIQLKDYSEACGLNGDMVNQVMADIFNHIWIDTNQKIIELNPRNGSFRTYLTTDNSMLLWRLIPTAMCKGKDGNMYFGGIPGICSVAPSNRLEREALPVKTFISDVKVMGKSRIFDKRKSNNKLSLIQLNPDDRNIEICFSSLNHRLAHKIRYAYKLNGIDQDWVFTRSGINSAFYGSLPKGRYVFQVKATDENGLWCDEVTGLTVVRLPAFYETWWAYLIYVVLIISSLTYCVYWYLKRVERKNNELWADSQEMMKMRNYLDSSVNLPEPEFIQLDKMLLEKAVKAVEDNLTEPDFGVVALADAMNMSRSTLTRKLKAITGRTPLDFIRNIKMKYAKHLLEDKDRSVTEVAATLGYLNRKYFTTCFKEEFGMTPSEYQKSLQ